MPLLLPNATKQQEIDHYAAWVAALPKGTYLHAMFSKTVGTVEREIRDDMACGPDVVKDRDEARKELEILTAQLKETNRQLEDARRTQDAVTRAIAQARREASSIARTMNGIANP